MRKHLLHFTATALLMLVSTSAAFATFGGGTGTATDPYQISTIAHLKHLSTIVMNDATIGFSATAGKHFKLMNDIDMAGVTDFTPIGWRSATISDGSSRAFAGNFWGNGKKIKNLVIDRPGKNNVALFGYTYNNSTIQDLGIEGGRFAGGSYVGSLIGISYGSVTNCYATGAVSGSDYYVGGLIGYSECSVTNCYATGEVSGSDYVGGLIGDSYDSVTNCYATGAVFGSGCVGGLIGDSSGSVTNCYATGAVSGSGYYVGGLIGYSEGSFTNCYATGAVSGNREVGGLIGDSSGSVTNCYATGAVFGSGYYVGGLIGRSRGSVTNCYAAPRSITSTSTSKGVLVGEVSDNASFTNCYYTTAISGVNGVGVGSSAGVVGKSEAQLKEPNMVTLLNSTQSPTVWMLDLTPNTNNGYPIISTTLFNQYLVSFNSEQGSPVASQTVDYNGLAARPTDPIRAGYRLEGWYRDVAMLYKWNFDSDRVTSNITLYAKWSVYTGIYDNQIADMFVVFVQRDHIIIESLPVDMEYSILSITGVVLENGISSGEPITRQLSSGVYLVRAGNITKKVVVR